MRNWLFTPVFWIVGCAALLIFTVGAHLVQGLSIMEPYVVQTELGGGACEIAEYLVPQEIVMEGPQKVEAWIAAHNPSPSTTRIDNC